MSTRLQRLAVVALGGMGMAIAAWSPNGAHAAPPSVASPCDSNPSAPFCGSAIGTLRDVSTSWRWYQAALIQPVPINDYKNDPEDAAPPVGAGVCGTETVHQPVDGTQVPPSTVGRAPFSGIPAPPGGWHSDSPYCVLRYIAGDFTPLCDGCARLFVDFDAIPRVDVTSNPVSPGADGHYALRLTFSDSNAAALINGHSPNAKNLCSDKFFNPSPGAECSSAVISGFDSMGLGIEGETGRYIHYPLEGRYYNGPAYLAGDGSTVPFHWVHGFYMDVKVATSRSVWYSGGYRGRGDVAPDTDQSYACPCEAAHFTFSPSITIAATAPAAAPRNNDTGVRAASIISLPVTAHASVAVPASVVLTAIVAVTVTVRRRRRRDAVVP